MPPNSGALAKDCEVVRTKGFDFRTGIQTKVLLSKMTTEEVRQRLKETSIAVVPVGSTEQHGPHLPLETDTCSAFAVALAAANRVQEKVKVVVVPPIAFGCSEHHMMFPGTITLSFDTFVNLLYEVGTSLIRHGFTKLLFVNGHGGNAAAINIACCRLTYYAGAKLAVAVNYWNLIKEQVEATRTTETGGMGHAGEFETSLMLYLCPEIVRQDSMPPPQIPPARLPGDFLDLVRKGTVSLPWLAHEVSSFGIIGDPNAATRGKGQAFFELTVKRLSELIIAMHERE